MQKGHQRKEYQDTLITQQSAKSHAVSQRVVPECVSQVATAALGWPVQWDGRLANAWTVHCAVLCVHVVAVERALKMEEYNKGYILNKSYVTENQIKQKSI